MSDAADWRLTVQAAVGAGPIVHVGPFWQMDFSLLRGLAGAGVGPFAQGGLDKPFCFAVGFRRVGLGSDVFQVQVLAG